ncbi:MAG: hypothetical protein HYS81_04420 [Candidatus Aenigmatarchaeota archaeon]|nr:MAG: hypothetical protein HYS81_04420 [Candidatus Aenigmarchaeota archaeon]
MHSKHANIFVSAALTLAGMTAAFSAVGGTISVGQAVLTILAIVAILVMLNIYLKVEQLTSELERKA